jgi:hypothetical protein
MTAVAPVATSIFGAARERALAKALPEGRFLKAEERHAMHSAGTRFGSSVRTIPRVQGLRGAGDVQGRNVPGSRAQWGIRRASPSCSTSIRTRFVTRLIEELAADSCDSAYYRPALSHAVCHRRWSAGVGYYGRGSVHLKNARGAGICGVHGGRRNSRPAPAGESAI